MSISVSSSRAQANLARSIQSESLAKNDLSGNAQEISSDSGSNDNSGNGSADQNKQQGFDSFAQYDSPWTPRAVVNESALVIPKASGSIVDQSRTHDHANNITTTRVVYSDGSVAVTVKEHDQHITRVTRTSASGQTDRTITRVDVAKGMQTVTTISSDGVQTSVYVPIGGDIGTVDTNNETLASLEDAAEGAVSGVNTVSTEPVATTGTLVDPNASELFQGEFSVGAQWGERQTELFDTLRDDYQSRRSVNRENFGSIGWSRHEVLNDDRDRVLYVTGNFHEDVFHDWYVSRPNETLETIAQHYNMPDVETLLATYPDIVEIAVRVDRVPGRGPGLDGLAMAPAEHLALMDIHLSDPEIQGLIDLDTRPVPEPTHPSARAQLYLYGQQRYEQMVQYNRVMESVRGAYASAIRGDRADAFLREDTPISRLANTLFGRSTTRQTQENSEGEIGFDTSFVAPGWRHSHGFGGSNRLQYDGIKLLNLDDLPGLHNHDAISFEPGFGWVTSRDNVKARNSFLSDAIKFTLVGAITYVTGGLATGFGAGLFGTATALSTTAGVVTGAALSGAISTAVSGAVYGNFDWDDVLKGAITGALTAGLRRIPAVSNLAQQGPVGSIAANTVVQGSTDVLMGGSFEDGAINGLVSGISNEMLNDMNASIEASDISGADKLAALQSARFIAVTVRMAHTDGHPSQLLAQELLQGFVEHAGAEAYDIAVAQGTAGGEATGDFFRELLSDDGSDDVSIGIINADYDGDDSKRVVSDELLKVQLDDYIKQFDDELSGELQSIEVEIARLDALISDSDFVPIRQMYEDERLRLTQDRAFLQEVASNPDAAIISLLAASASRDSSGMSASDLGHLGLDIVGLLPVVGEFADGVNAVWYGAEGRTLDAALSTLGMAPGIGMGATVTRWAARVSELPSIATGHMFRVTKDMLGNGGKFAGRTNAGPNARAFDSWLEASPNNRIDVLPDGSIRYSGTHPTDGGSYATTFSPDGVPDFTPYSRGQVEIEIDVDARRGNTSSTDNSRFRNDDYRAASEALWNSIKNDPIAQSRFTQEQLSQLEAGAEKITDLTWHHTGHTINGTSGPLSLVETIPHQLFTHRGWQSYLRGGEI